MMAKTRPDAAGESLAIPHAVRAAVDERDGLTCRLCGKYLGDRRCLHHIFYGGDEVGMGGRRIHDPNTIITLCWLPGDPMFGVAACHERVHSSKAFWQPLLAETLEQPGVTALQIRRWRASKTKGTRRGTTRDHPRG